VLNLTERILGTSTEEEFTSFQPHHSSDSADRAEMSPEVISFYASPHTVSGQSR